MTREDWDPRRSEGGSAFAGVLLLLVGVWQLVIGYGIVAGGAFVFTGGGYWYRADDAGWGWVNLVIGAAAVVAGLGQLGVGRRLTRRSVSPTPALVVAVVSALNQFLLAPQYPLWASLAVAVDVFAIWVLATRVRQGDGEPDRMTR